jgi:hypothetical protein
LKAQYGELYSQLVALFYRHDPAGLAYADNFDEYESEVGTVLPRLGECRSPQDMEQVIRTELRRSLGMIFLSNDALGALAADVWSVWQDCAEVPERPSDS